MSAIWALIENTALHEYRNRSQGIGIFVLIWVICYMVFRLNPSLSSANVVLVFWIFVVLTAINVVMRQEAHLSPEEKMALYTLANPVLVIISRIIFNFFFLLVISVVFYGLLHIYFESVQGFSLLMIFLFALGALAISSSLTLVSAIGMHGGGQSTLISVLGLPLLLPVVIVLNNLMNAIIVSGNMPGNAYLLVIAIAIASMAMSLVLFPYIWKK